MIPIIPGPRNGEQARVALYEPAPQPDPDTKSKGRTRKKGARLPGMAAWAEDPEQPWTELKFDQFGLHATLSIKTRRALY